MRDKTILSIWAATMLTLLEITALITGLDGAFFLPVVGAVCFVAGHQLKAVTTDEQVYK